MNCEQLLCLILQCGTDELSILRKIRYDVLESVVMELASKNRLTFDNVMTAVCEKAILLFKREILNKIPSLRDELSEYFEFNDTGEGDLPDSIVHVPEVYRYGYMDVDNFSEPAGKDLARLDLLNPEDDIQPYVNASATRMYIVNYADVYSRLFREELEKLEKVSGIPVANVTLD